MRSKEFVEAVARLRAAVRDRLGAQPEHLKPFAAERPVPEQLRRSRARVQALLSEAKKNQ
jgi:hypothetical protein